MHWSAEDELLLIEDELNQNGAIMNEQIESLLQMIIELRNEIAELRDRVGGLEWQSKQREDKEGYEEQGPRYSGKHPHSCACDRCLQARYGRWGE